MKKEKIYSRVFFYAQWISWISQKNIQFLNFSQETGGLVIFYSQLYLESIHSK
jgi:hypothetical protein